MNKRHNSAPKTRARLIEYFRKPTSFRQKQYEAVRAVVVEKQAVKTVAEKFSYTVNTVYSLLRDAKAGKIDFFPLLYNGSSRGRRACFKPYPIENVFVFDQKLIFF